MWSAYGTKGVLVLLMACLVLRSVRTTCQEQHSYASPADLTMPLPHCDDSFSHQQATTP
jgi:hypothetical protein